MQGSSTLCSGKKFSCSGKLFVLNSTYIMSVIWASIHGGCVRVMWISTQWIPVCRGRTAEHQWDRPACFEWQKIIALDCHHAHFIVSGSNLYVGSRSWGSDPQPFLTLACNSRLQSGSDLTFNQRQLELVEKGFWLLCIVVLTYKRLPFDHCHMWNDYDNIWLVNWHKMVYVVLWVNNVCYPIWHKLEQKSCWKIAVCTHWLYIGG